MDKTNIISKYLEKTEYINRILLDLENIILDAENFEGNCFYLNKTFVKKTELINKQLNLFWSGCESPAKICEIGFNAGHSTLLLLLGNNNKNINFTIFDINHHPYTNTCYEYIKTIFPDVNFNFIEGNSVISIPNWINNTQNYEFFDIIHIDGCHLIDIVTQDFANSIKILKKNGLLIIDDVQKEHIDKLVNIYISTGAFEEITYIFETTLYPHRILKKIL
jgi:hypothetical protein